MKRIFSLLAVLVFVFLGSFAQAAVPTCQLGGPTAVNPNRQLAEGETFVTTDRALVVNLAFKPTKEFPDRVGECVLPKGTEVAVKNGILVWVKACGNDEVNRNIPVGPTQGPAPAQVATPTPAPTKPLAEAAKEHVERDGDKPINVSVEVPVTINNGGSRATALIIGGSILAGVVAVLIHDHNKKDEATRTPQPKIRTDGASGGLGFGITLPLGGS